MNVSQPSCGKPFQTKHSQSLLRRLRERELGTPLVVTFQGELRHDQKIAAVAMLVDDTSVLSATTAFGKIVVAAWLIAKRAVNTMVLVHRKQLQKQWVDRSHTFLGLPAREIGRVGGG